MEGSTTQKAPPQGIGNSVRRVEDRRFLDGGGEYLADLQIPGMWDLAFLRSPVAHAKLNGVRVPECHSGRVFLIDDIGFAQPIVADSSAPGFKHSEYPPLARDRIRFVGEPVAMCIAPTRAEAEDIAQACELDIEELPVLFDIDEALKPDAPALHDGWS
ncbi:MAG: xanthine dehydrogenase family protein molybdopterin-binding subunit, partial [Gammaproteobacteria bacterium]|nr:xanthine dehydrogenase family protein molybdopterin-binding subunit [Gammaproteobacteria bacterium]